jgi:hypothetical protein
MILIILGLAFILWVVGKMWSCQKVKAWEEVKCTITKAETESFEEAQVNVVVTLLRPLIEYSYSYNGHDYSCNTISLEDKSLKASPEKSNYFWYRWSQGETCIAYVNPKNPQQAILYRGLIPNRKSHYLSLTIVGILLISIGAWLQYAQP